MCRFGLCCSMLSILYLAAGTNAFADATAKASSNWRVNTYADTDDDWFVVGDPAKSIYVNEARAVLGRTMPNGQPPDVPFVIGPATRHPNIPPGDDKFVLIAGKAVGGKNWISAKQGSGSPAATAAGKSGKGRFWWSQAKATCLTLETVNNFAWAVSFDPFVFSDIEMEPNQWASLQAISVVSVLQFEVLLDPFEGQAEAVSSVVTSQATCRIDLGSSTPQLFDIYAEVSTEAGSGRPQ